MHDTSFNSPGAEELLRKVEQTIRGASARYANRFGIERLREEIVAESIARVLTLACEGRPPFNEPVDAEGAVDRMQRYTHGLVANVAREALRGRVRHAHAPLTDRAGACAVLQAGAPAPEDALEMQEVVSQALRRFHELDTDVRETIVAEQIMQNDYASREASRLCRSCKVSFQRVWTMIEKRKSGAWSAEAWRQRVHRSRKKARAAVGALAPFTLAIALVAGLIAMTGAPAPQQRTRAHHAPALTQPSHLAENGSTQNGKARGPVVLLASTQNGKAGGKG